MSCPTYGLDQFSPKQDIKGSVSPTALANSSTCWEKGGVCANAGTAGENIIRLSAAKIAVFPAAAFRIQSFEPLPVICFKSVILLILSSIKKTANLTIIKRRLKQYVFRRHYTTI